MTSPRPTYSTSLKLSLATAAALVGCNSSMSGLDRGHVSVAGLSKASSAAVSAPPETSVTLANLQTRQTATVILSAATLAHGRFLALSKIAPGPAVEIFKGVAYPTADDPVTNDNVTLRLNQGGGITVNFYTAALVRTNGMSYGKNMLEFTVSDNGDSTAVEDVTVTLEDFPISSVAMTSFVSGGQVSEAGDAQGWVSLFATPSVTEVNPGSNGTTLQTGMFNMINP